MSETFKKDKGKSIPYTIDDSVRARIKSFSDMLVNMKEDYGEDSKQAKTIDIILTKLDAYDRNIIIAFFEYEQSPTALGRLLGVSPSVIISRITKIKKTIQSYL